MLRVEIYSGTRKILKHNSRNKICRSDQQLHGMALCVYHGIKVQVEGVDGERIAQMCWWTGSQSWRGGDRRNNWTWVTQWPGRCYSALNGRVPWQLQRLFKIKLCNEDGAFVEYWLALALTTISENSGNVNPVVKFVQVRKAPETVDLQVFSMGNIVCCMHIIPERATSSNRDDRWDKRWIVNSHIDLGTWNNVYA